jgi:hypothetical protein
MLLHRLQRGEEGQECSWRDRTADTKQSARDLLKRCHLRVALERLRERRGAPVADFVTTVQALRAFRPFLRRRVRDARGETEPPAQSRARATYVSVVSVALLLSASESAAAPRSPIWLFCRLQRGEGEGQRCSWQDRAAGTEQGVRDLLELSQRRVALERLRERRGAPRQETQLYGQTLGDPLKAVLWPRQGPAPGARVSLLIEEAQSKRGRRSRFEQGVTLTLVAGSSRGV